MTTSDPGEKQLPAHVVQQIRDLVWSYHGRANFVLLVHGSGSDEPTTTFYTSSCCPHHKRELYEVSAETLEAQVDLLVEASRADTLPPPDELH